MVDRDKFFTVRREVDIEIVELRLGAGAILTPDDLMYALRQAVDGIGSAHVVIDFARVESCPSSVIAALLATHRRVERLGGRMKFAIPSAHVRIVFKQLNLDKLLEIYDQRDDAVRAFREELMQSQ